MRKIFFLYFACCAATLVYSQYSVETVQEQSLSWGLESGFFFEKYKYEGDTYNNFYISPGLRAKGDNFIQGESIGYFFDGFVLLPAYLEEKENGTRANTSRDDYDDMMLVGFLFGPVYRHAISNRLELCAGVGFSLSFASIEMTIREFPPDYPSPPSQVTLNASKTSLIFGVGGDVNVKFNFSDEFFLSMGTSLVWDFASMAYTELSYTTNNVTITGSESDFEKNYSMLSIRPYLCFGFYLYTKAESGRGRAPPQ